MAVSMQNILFMKEIQPHLLDLPVEVLYQILGYLFDEELEDWCPFGPHPCQPPWCRFKCPPKRHIPLSYNAVIRRSMFQDILRKDAPTRPGHIKSVALVCRGLRHHSRRLLESRYEFLVAIDVRKDAPSAANAFREIDSLDTVVRDNPRSNIVDNFRKNIKHLTVCMVANFDHFYHATRLSEWANNETRTVLLIERVVENLVQLLELMPGLTSMHLVLGTMVGNSGMNDIFARYCQIIFVRMRAEAEGRRMQVQFSAQSLFGMIWPLDLERCKLAGKFESGKPAGGSQRGEPVATQLRWHNW